MCLGLGFVCSPPLLARVLGCVCVCVRASLVPPHSWLGCAVWVCVLGLRSRLRAATAGGVLKCVCVCERVPLVPRHSWLGCAVWVCVLRLGFRLRPASPGWGVGACVCLWVRSACITPPLAGVCGVSVCAWARGSAAPCHSWLGCWGVCVFVCALRLYPATPGWGVRCGCVSLAQVSAAPRHSWLGCWALCVFVCTLCLYLAIPCCLVQCGCVCLGSGLGSAPPLLAGLLGCICVCGRAPLVPRHSPLGCAVRVCVLGLGIRLRRATPGSGVGVSVCFCARSACTPPFLAAVCGVGMCAWAQVPAAPRTPGWGVGVYVCLWARRACTPPLLAGVCGVGVCAWARVLAAPRHSWQGCWGVCVLVCALRLYPAPPGWGVRCECVCLGSRFGCAPPLLAGVLRCACLWARPACNPPLLAGVCGVGVCAWARLWAAPRHSSLGCWCVCVFVGALRLYPATAGWGVRCGCVCLGLGFICALPLLAGVMGSVCVCVCAPPLPLHSWLGCARWVCVLGFGFRLRPATPGWPVGVCLSVCTLCLYPATPGWGVWCGCVWLGLGFGCAPPLLVGVLGSVFACVRAPLVPRHSWPGFAVWVCLLGFRFRLRSPLLAGVLGFVCWCAPSACTPPFLARVCGVRVGCRPAPVPVLWFVAGCARCPGLRHPVAVVAWLLYKVSQGG